jgi:release factor glutamine methyltransferase
VRTGDWRSAEPGPYDLVVSNPPYIPTSAISALTPEVRAFDPVLALDGGPDGLDCYRSIAVLLPCILAPGGKSVLEIGHDQAVAVTKILTEAGFAVMPPRVDAGGNPRALVASMPKNPRIPTETGNS